MGYSIKSEFNPEEASRVAVGTPLRAYNFSKVGDPHKKNVALLIQDDELGEAIGGLYGEIYQGWFFIELLAVPEQARGQGLGSQLVCMAEEIARNNACVGMWLDTFDFQAPLFYAKHGFTEFGHLSDFPKGHKRFFLQKRL